MSCPWFSIKPSPCHRSSDLFSYKRLLIVTGATVLHVRCNARFGNPVHLCSFRFLCRGVRVIMLLRYHYGHSLRNSQLGNWHWLYRYILYLWTANWYSRPPVCFVLYYVWPLSLRTQTMGTARHGRNYMLRG